MIYLLVFADDMVKMRETPAILYGQCIYCQRWGLNVNIEKTKVLVTKVVVNQQFSLCNTPLQIVSYFNYLGATLS